jgi:hypothetical protein
MKPIICECGTTKDDVHGVTSCPHCERPCDAMSQRRWCQLCAAYSAKTNNRVTLEYGAEKRRNGK